MFKLKNPDGVIDIRSMNISGTTGTLKAGKGGVSHLPVQVVKDGVDSMSSRGPNSRFQFDSFEETLAMLSQVTDQVTEFKTKYNKHMSAGIRPWA
jgi:hypothetical protein